MGLSSKITLYKLMHPSQIRHLSKALSEQVMAVSPVSGGDIAEAWHVRTSTNVYFAKTGLTSGVSDTFKSEAQGLAALKQAHSGLIVPYVVAQESGILVLEWLEPVKATEEHFRKFGEGLAKLHQSFSPTAAYGFQSHNFIGRTRQLNSWQTDWPTFFLENRLWPMAERCRKAKRWPATWEIPFQSLCKALPQILPKHPPASLLHGDLWHGNVCFTPNGPAVIDPAVYYGDRETDLAMTTLFGGFSSVFYESYQFAWPFASGFEERKPLYNLYHLLNHLLLFGSSYAGSVATTLKKFG